MSTTKNKMITGKNNFTLNNEDAQIVIDILNDTIYKTKTKNQPYALNVQRIRDILLGNNNPKQTPATPATPAKTSNVEYKILNIDEHGDAYDVNHTDTLSESLKTVEDTQKDLDKEAIVIERVLLNSYQCTIIHTFGNKEALQKGGWI